MPRLRLRKQLGTQFLCKPQVGEKQSHLTARHRSLLQKPQRFRSGGYTKDPIVLRVTLHQLLLDQPQMLGVIIDGKKQGPGHRLSKCGRSAKTSSVSTESDGQSINT